MCKQSLAIFNRYLKFGFSTKKKQTILFAMQQFPMQIFNETEKLAEHLQN